jgi:hypothetical protein
MCVLQSDPCHSPDAILQIVITGTKIHRGYALVPFILKQLFSMEFAKDWEALEHQTGGKKSKTEYYKQSFIKNTIYAPRFTSLEEHGVENVMKELAAPYKAYKRAHGEIIKARMNLLCYYRQVSGIPCFILSAVNVCCSLGLAFS